MPGVIAGGPTFVGTLLGRLWTNDVLNIFMLAVAGCAILYVLNEMFARVGQAAPPAVLNARPPLPRR